MIEERIYKMRVRARSHYTLRGLDMKGNPAQRRGYFVFTSRSDLRLVACAPVKEGFVKEG